MKKELLKVVWLILLGLMSCQHNFSTENKNDNQSGSEFTVYTSKNKIFDPAWSPDGSQIAFIWQSPAIDFYLMSPSGDTLEWINRFYKDIITNPCTISPDGLYIYYVDNEWNHNSHKYNSYFYSVAQDSSLLYNNILPANIYDINWSCDSQMIYYMCKRNYLLNIDTKTLKGATVFTVILDSIKTVQNFNLAPDNRRLILSCKVKNNGFYQLWLCSPDSGQKKILATNYLDYNNPSWSPDGNSLAFITFNYKTRTKSLNIYSFANDSTITIADSINISSFYPIVWSNDGQQLYFVDYVNYTDESRTNIWQVSLSDYHCSLLYSNHTANILQVNSDGTFYTTSDVFQVNRLYSLDVNQKKISLLTPETDEQLSHPTWSPDGASLVFSKKQKLYKIPAGGGQPESLDIRLSDYQYNPSFSPDGSSIAFDDKVNIYIYSTNDRAVKRVSFKKIYPDLINPVWSPDGAQIACTTKLSNKDSLIVFNYNDGIFERVQAWPGLYSSISWSNPYPGLGSFLLLAEAITPTSIRSDYELKILNIENYKLWTLVGHNGTLINDSQNYIGACWSPDAESIAWIQNKDYYSNNYSLNIARNNLEADNKE